MLRLATAIQDGVDPLDLVFSDSRRADGRPWVALNMVSSLDGGTAVDGRSSSLGDEDDYALFQALRTVPDVILAGATTVTSEDYRPVRLDGVRRARRSEEGLTETPTLAVVSGRLSVDPEARLFGDPEHKPLLMTSTSAEPGKLALLGDSADVAILPDLDPASILDHLGAARVVLLEGGPTLNGGFVAAGLVDEINVSVAPRVLSGDSARIIRGPGLAPASEWEIDRVLFGDEMLFVRYLAKT